MVHNIKPRDKRVIVKVDKTEEKTMSGLYLPSDMQKYFLKGSVLAAAQDCVDLVVGDIVYFYPETGREIDPEVLMIKEEDIWGTE
jgi:co-chaperonin GroES (HSP10)